MHIHKWVNGSIFLEKFDRVVEEDEARKCLRCGEIQFTVYGYGSVYMDTRVSLNDSEIFIPSEACASWRRDLLAHVHERMTTYRYCPTCGAPLQTDIEVVSANPKTGAAIRSSVTIYCEKKHVSYNYKREER